MDDVEEAKALIQQIRQERGVLDDQHTSANAEDLHAALQLQFAPGVTPSLKLRYREDGWLWIGCNEIGFTAGDVVAISRIHKSTKAVSGGQKGYIGEKGIGFKSVFKVADVAWIKSGALSFKFDDNKPLGKVVPEWADFPHCEHLNERTMICLRIPKQSDHGIFNKGLENMKPELLSFLRRLRNIDVEIRSATNVLRYGYSIRRTDAHINGLRVVNLENQLKAPRSRFEVERLLVFAKTITGMPAEEKRVGVKESELVLGFPVDDKYEPIVGKRDTFNFLPVRSYGLPFLL